MKRGNRPELMWGLGLTPTEETQIRQAMGPGFHLKNFPKGSLPGGKQLSRVDVPGTAWIPWREWSSIPENRREDYRSLDTTQRILIQEDAEEQVELEKVLEEGFLTVIRTPLTQSKVQDAVFRAKEVTSLYKDIYRMTEEIFLERELLSRKTDQLLFLNRILSNAVESLDVADILSSAQKDLNLILPVRLLQAVFWQQGEAGGAQAEFFMRSRMDARVQESWIQTMIDAVDRYGSMPVDGFSIEVIDKAVRPLMDISPEDGRVMHLPLRAGSVNFGCLIMLCDPETRLAKDQVETLRAASNHLALAIRNALLFQEVKFKADRDGLTRIHNRASFDERLVEEMRRHQRYNHELSLLMIDLDHFKDVNDTYGHLAGDTVLREVAGIFQSTLRSSDFAARYGGEEFVILLPHTGEKDAWNLAERLRERIENRLFRHDCQSFNVTASIGVASLRSGSLGGDSDLVLQADQALYAAKRNGRNMVVVSGREAEKKTI